MGEGDWNWGRREWEQGEKWVENCGRRGWKLRRSKELEQGEKEMGTKRWSLELGGNGRGREVREKGVGAGEKGGKQREKRKRWRTGKEMQGLGIEKMRMRTERKGIGAGREVGGNRERRGVNWNRMGDNSNLATVERVVLCFSIPKSKVIVMMPIMSIIK